MGEETSSKRKTEKGQSSRERACMEKTAHIKLEKVRAMIPPLPPFDENSVDIYF